MQGNPILRNLQIAKLNSIHHPQGLPGPPTLRAVLFLTHFPLNERGPANALAKASLGGSEAPIRPHRLLGGTKVSEGTLVPICSIACDQAEQSSGRCYPTWSKIPCRIKPLRCILYTYDAPSSVYHPMLQCIQGAASLVDVDTDAVADDNDA
jgi:hypothetical protein